MEELEGLPVLHCADEEQWRAWLQAHDASAAGVWLVFAKARA